MFAIKREREREKEREREREKVNAKFLNGKIKMRSHTVQ